MNILVGPNNSGKSTIIGAFRALAAGLRTARARASQLLQGPGGDPQRGYDAPPDSIPIALEDAQHDYGNIDSFARFTLSNGNRLVLHFPPGGGRCQLFCEYETGGPIRGPGDFLRLFPVSVALVPELGPVEHEETLIKEETVQRNLASHTNEFDEFRRKLEDTWPGRTW